MDTKQDELDEQLHRNEMESDVQDFENAEYLHAEGVEPTSTVMLDEERTLMDALKNRY